MTTQKGSENELFRFRQIVEAGENISLSGKAHLLDTITALKNLMAKMCHVDELTARNKEITALKVEVERLKYWNKLNESEGSTIQSYFEQWNRWQDERKKS